MNITVFGAGAWGTAVAAHMSFAHNVVLWGRDAAVLESIASQRDAFIERFLQFASGTFSLFSIYIGDQLGLYRATRHSLQQDRRLRLSRRCPSAARHRDTACRRLF